MYVSYMVITTYRHLLSNILMYSARRGSVPSNEMFKLFDRYGNTLVLRPDMTPSIARAAASTLKTIFFL